MFNPSPSARAKITATLRGCVCVYLCYLGVALIRGAGAPDTTMPVWLAWVFGVFLILAAAAFALYTFLHWQTDRAAAALREQEEKGEPEKPEETAKEEAQHDDP